MGYFKVVVMLALWVFCVLHLILVFIYHTSCNNDLVLYFVLLVITLYVYGLWFIALFMFGL